MPSGGGSRNHALRRSEADAARLAELMQRISSDLIGSPHHTLESTIERALAGLGEALGADRSMLATRDLNGFFEHQVWERRAPAGQSRPRPAGPLPLLL